MEYCQHVDIGHLFNNYRKTKVVRSGQSIRTQENNTKKRNKTRSTNSQPVPTVGKHTTGAKHGKPIAGKHANGAKRWKPSAGSQAREAKRGHTCYWCQANKTNGFPPDWYVFFF